MEEFMKQALAVREAELERLVDVFMSDPAFAECRDDEMLWEATSADGLDSPA
jgi:hypothetical protein